MRLIQEKENTFSSIKREQRASFRIRLPFFIFLLVFIIAMAGCGIFQGQDKMEPENPEKTAVIWEIQKNKAVDPSYIVGIPEPYCFDPLENGKRFYRALADVDIALVPYFKPKDQQMATLTNKLKMKNNLILDSLLSANHQKRLRTWLKDTVGINPDDYQQVPPLLLNKLVHKKIPSCSPDKTYLREVLKASRRSKNIKMVSVFNKQDLIKRYQKPSSYKKQADILMQTAKDYEKIKTLQEHMRFTTKTRI